jgi:hypothetical protein
MALVLMGGTDSPEDFVVLLRKNSYSGESHVSLCFPRLAGERAVVKYIDWYVAIRQASCMQRSRRLQCTGSQIHIMHKSDLLDAHSDLLAVEQSRGVSGASLHIPPSAIVSRSVNLCHWMLDWRHIAWMKYVQGKI